MVKIIVFTDDGTWEEYIENHQYVWEITDAGFAKLISGDEPRHLPTFDIINKETR